MLFSCKNCREAYALFEIQYNLVKVKPNTFIRLKDKKKLANSFLKNKSIAHAIPLSRKLQVQ